MEIKELIYDLQRAKDYNKQVELIEEYVMHRLTDQAITICTNATERTKWKRPMPASRGRREEKSIEKNPDTSWTTYMYLDDNLNWRNFKNDKI